MRVFGCAKRIAGGRGGRANESAEWRWLDLSGGNAKLAHDLFFILRFIKKSKSFRDQNSSLVKFSERA
jgi:hypothetical protein